MKTMAVNAGTLRTAGRLDCWYFLSPASSTVVAVETARQRGVRIEQLGGSHGVAERVHHPNRYTRALAANGEPSLPYLRPYDVFNYYPEAADYVSAGRTENLDDYHLKSGQILQTRSGRNLGPAVLVDAHLAQFVMSDDMIRLEIADKQMRFYTLAYLNSQTGRRMLRRDKTGSVIDHLSEDQVASQEVLIFDAATFREVASLVGRAVKLRESARLTISQLLAAYESELPALRRAHPLRDGWTVRSRVFEGRLDAAFYDPLVSTVRRQLLRLGGKRVADVAQVLKPAGRYKTCYVDRDNGRPLLSGAQLLQTSLINLQYMAPRVFKDITAYELRPGWIAYPADGRAEEELGTPAFITKDRAGWLASGHVGRVIAKPGVDVGWLFLALKTSHAQMQLKARASGSVVDSTFPEDMEEVILPPPLDVDGAKVVQLWEDFREAQALEEQASVMIDEQLARCSC
ncbi:MAG: hypothetical protein AB1705_15625 [Verrucomicrobiota bacterium]